MKEGVKAEVCAALFRDLISYLCVSNSALSASGFLQFFGVCTSIAPVKKWWPAWACHFRKRRRHFCKFAVELAENSIAPPASGKWW
jgi:hypothetical protein